MPFDGTNYKIHTNQDKALMALRDAREQMAQPRAWCKYHFDNYRGAHCIMGWLHVTYVGNVDMLVADHLMPLLKPEFDSIVDYNDHDKTRKRDMLRILDRAIVNLEKSK